MEHHAQDRAEREAQVPGRMEPAAVRDAREHWARHQRALSERSALDRADFRLVSEQGVSDREASGRLWIGGGHVRWHGRSERAISRRACSQRPLMRRHRCANRAGRDAEAARHALNW